MNNDVSKNASIVMPQKMPIEKDLSDFIYESIDTSSFIKINAWSEFFDAIPVDPYIKDGYRYKAIAWFRVKHCKASTRKEIDERIIAINKLGGMDEDENNQYTSNGEPAWSSKETGYECWELPQYAMQQSITA